MEKTTAASIRKGLEESQAFVTLVESIDAEIRRTKKNRGEVVCPNCGGTVSFEKGSGRAFKASCDTCSMRVMG